MTYTLYHGDCLTEMDRIADKSIDAIIADLPYGTTACSWDSVIPFEPLWVHFKRVLKERGAVVLFGSQPFTSALVMSNPRGFSHSWIWEKENGTNFFMVNRAPFKVHEDICIFYGGKSYNPQYTAGDAYRVASGTHHRPYLGSPESANGTITDNPGIRWPRSIQEFTSEKGLHPTQKPVALLEYLVKTYTNPGDTVLDCTMGSGTTGVACGRLNRSFVGIEQDAGYFEIAKTRIMNAYDDFVRTPEEVARGQLALFGDPA